MQLHGLQPATDRRHSALAMPLQSLSSEERSSDTTVLTSSTCSDSNKENR